MAIPEGFLNELIARSDILEIVSRYVVLKKSGSAYFGLCPFHNEKTASFSVTPERQVYHCFGCGAGGGVIRFIMNIEGMDFPEAVRFLADLAGMSVPEDDRETMGQKKRRERLLALNREAALYFNALLSDPAGADALEYLLKKRELSKKTVKEFGLGYAPLGWDHLIRAMGEKGYDKTDLLDAGLAAKSPEGRIYDRFRNRVMFPIIDLKGGVLGFGGRVMDDSQPKYLNSPETQVFQKSYNLFALNRARKAKSRRVILAEGYMDVIALHQAGFHTAVASLGTSLTKEQARLLTRYADEVVIAYDADEAGRRAVRRAIEILQKTGLAVKVLTVPGAKDPDEYIRKNGADAFELLLNRSENHIEYKLQAAMHRHDLSSDEGKVAYLKEAVAELAELPGAVEREIYANRAAQAAGVSPGAVELELKRALARRKRKQMKEEHRKIVEPVKKAQPAAKGLVYENVRSAKAEEGVLALCFANPDLLLKEALALRKDEFSSSFLGEVFERMAARQKEGNSVSFDSLAEGMDEGQVNHLAGIFAKEPPADEKRALGDFIEIIQKEHTRKTGGRDELLFLAERYREKKGSGGRA